MSLQLADNYFELLGVDIDFHVAQEKIDDQYQKFQIMLHPDRYAGASEQVRRVAAQKSASINEAYRVLSDDCARAAYLLELEGVRSDSEKETIKDPEFLAEQMGLREQLADAGDDVTTLKEIRQTAQEKLTEYGKAFDQAYTGKAFAQAGMILFRMQFARKLSAEANAKIKSIAPN